MYARLPFDSQYSSTHSAQTSSAGLEEAGLAAFLATSMLAVLSAKHCASPKTAATSAKYASAHRSTAEAVSLEGLWATEDQDDTDADADRGVEWYLEPVMPLDLTMDARTIANITEQRDKACSWPDLTHHHCVSFHVSMPASSPCL